MNWLLLFIPVAAGLEALAPGRHLLIFAAAALAILPLARWLGLATEQLAVRLGEGVGGLLNATFGNAVELIIALAALHAGLHDVVKASIVGAIIGNMLLVLGDAMLAAGLRRPEQHFNAAGARSEATMLTLVAIALILPAAFQAALGAKAAESLGKLSISISVVLLLIYLLYLAFTLITHSSLFAGSDPIEEGESHEPRWSLPRAALVLAIATAGIAWMSEIMVRAALKNRMDLSLSIAIGSSIQVALFVAPVLVLASLFVGPAPMDLAFPAGLVLTVLLAVLITGQVAGDGRSDWLKGAQLLAVYLVLGLTFFFMPAASASP